MLLFSFADAQTISNFAMDYIKELDIILDKEYYYAGEAISGKVKLDTLENFKLKCKYKLPGAGIFIFNLKPF